MGAQPAGWGAPAGTMPPMQGTPPQGMPPPYMPPPGQVSTEGMPDVPANDAFAVAAKQATLVDMCGCIIDHPFQMLKPCVAAAYAQNVGH